MKLAITANLKAIEKTKVSIVKLRDQLRAQVDDLEDILESCDEAVNCLDDGMRAFSDAADELSKYL